MAQVMVVGGGAAGLIAAWRSAALGHRVQLLEANARLGVKLRISGGGKCNVTHAGSPQELMRAFPAAQGRFLREGFHAFGSEAIRELLAERGVITQARENGRVFPEDRPGSAAAVVAALEGVVREAGVQVHFGVRIQRLLGEAPQLLALEDETGHAWAADHFILATGGASYPETGTRGDLLKALRSLGLRTRPWFPALAPIPLQAPRPAWEGVALREGALELWAGPGGRRLGRFPGDLLFTRTGISGPAALELSEAVEVARREGKAWLSYAVTAEREEGLEADLLAGSSRQPHLAVKTWLNRWLPDRLCEPLMLELGLRGDQRFKDLSRAGRRGLVGLLTRLPLGEPGPIPLVRGEVAAGGLRLEAVDPATMQVRGWQNLRVCGELLDLNGPIGGYNLQAAFSTGFLAGNLAG